MDDRDIFHQAMLCHGGRLLNDATVPDRLREDCELKTLEAKIFIDVIRASSPNLPPIHFDFVKNGKIGAWAFRSNGRHFIGVHDGTLIALTFLFGRIMADWRVLPLIGNPGEEAQSLPPFEAVPDADQMGRGKPLYQPLDPERALYAQFLTSLAFRFLVDHEISHIRHGHVDYAGDKFGSPFIPEFGWHPSGAEAGLLMQTLEMDADAGATCCGVRGARWCLADPGLVPAPFRHRYQEPTQALFDWTFAVQSVFRLFGDDRLSGVGLPLSSHPPCRARQAMVAATIKKYIATKWDAGLDEPITATVLQAGVESERAFLLITDSTPSIEGLREVGSRLGVDYVNSLRGYWQTKLRAELLPYTYTPLPD